jgi:hypothetical protein
MGMDLQPRSSDVDWFHTNWHGWRCLGQLLEDLGCDTKAMSGSNDGAYIDAETCHRWGHMVLAAADSNRIRLKRIKDDSYFGGERTAYVVDDTIGTEDLPLDDIAWLLKFGLFMKKCSGCYQY